MKGSLQLRMVSFGTISWRIYLHDVVSQNLRERYAFFGCEKDTDPVYFMDWDDYFDFIFRLATECAKASA